jgi:superfamily I DNA and/or RNA helicase
MFSIANQIAYSNQMVRAVEDAPFDCSLGESAWFHIDGISVRDGQVIGEEIELLKQHVQKLNTSGQLNNVFVISPFKSVAKECKSALKNYPGISCGTIHTFQGKEADIVFLVLGSDPSKPKSREWASSKPNILNVAITRAKKRLYVIGNKNLWGACNYFNVLAADLKS